MFNKLLETLSRFSLKTRLKEEFPTRACINEINAIVSSFPDGERKLLLVSFVEYFAERADLPPSKVFDMSKPLEQQSFSHETLLFMPYKRFLGYRKGVDGLPEITAKEEEVVRAIYKRFLEGDTICMIAKKLNEQGIPSPAEKKKKTKWCISMVESILTNEKYKGDTLLQKTYCMDFLTKKMKVNEGEVPQYYVQDNHPAIVDADVFDLVQMELARRKALKEVLDADELKQERVALEEKLLLLNECIRRLVNDNARIQLIQEAYQKEYDELSAQYGEAMNRIGEIDEETRSREMRKKQIKLFLRMFERQEVDVEFDAGMFVAMVERTTVSRTEGGRELNLRFALRDGQEILNRI